MPHRLRLATHQLTLRDHNLVRRLAVATILMNTGSMHKGVGSTIALFY
jgi:hypothetical protein